MTFQPGSLSGPLFRVADTLEALNALARQSRKRSKATIVAVTGSVGKTGTKEMLRTMLSASGATHASEKSYNNLWGVPLSIARMPRDAAFGVFEIGMNHAGEITPLTSLVRPHIAIVTWVAPVHIEFFKSVAEIADAKAEIFEGFEQGGTAILPADNEHFARLAARARSKDARVVTFGESPGVDARLLSYEAVEEGSVVTADILGTRLTFQIRARGRHLASNAIAALAASKLAGARVETAAECLARFEAPEGRGRSTAYRHGGRPGSRHRRVLQRQSGIDARGAGGARDNVVGRGSPAASRSWGICWNSATVGHNSTQNSPMRLTRAASISFSAPDR